MAPRRGGGGFGSFGSSSTYCSSYAFYEEWSRVAMAFHALCFVAFVVLLCLASVRLFRSQRKGRAMLRWWPLAVAIISRLINLTLIIVVMSLEQCDILTTYHTGQLYTAMEWFATISTVALIAVIMIPMTRLLHSAAGRPTKLLTIVHSVLLGLIAVLFVTYTGILTQLNDRHITGPTFDDIYDHYTGVVVATDVFAVIGILTATVGMGFLLVRHSQLRSGALKITIPLLIVSSLGMVVQRLAGNVHVFYFQPERISSSDYDSFDEYEDAVDAINRAYNVRLFFRHFFPVCTVIFALLVGGSRHLSDQSPVNPAVYPAAQEPKYDNNSAAPPFYQPQPQPYQQQPYQQQPVYQPQPYQPQPYQPQPQPQPYQQVAYQPQQPQQLPNSQS